MNPVACIRAETRFIDSEVESWNLDPALLSEALATAHTEGRYVGAVIAVDLLGQCADYARVEEICAKFDVPLIEDAAEALGTTYDGRPAGSFGTGARMFGGAVSGRLFATGMCLPSGTQMTKGDLDRVIGIVRSSHNGEHL